MRDEPVGSGPQEISHSHEVIKKPLWIPILGYLVVISGLSSLSDIVVSLIFGEIHLDIGVLFIWLGSGMIQYHTRSMRIFAGLSVVSAVLILLISIIAITSKSNSYFMLMGNTVEPGSPVFIIGFSFLLALAILLLAMPAIVRRSQRYLVEHAVFTIKGIPRSAIPSIVGIVFLSAMLGITDFTQRMQSRDAEEREKQMSQLDYFKIAIKLKDKVTGDGIYYAGYSVDAVPLTGGIVYSDGILMSGEDGATFRCFGVPPFKVMISVSRAGYQPMQHQVSIHDTKSHREVELVLTPQE